MSASYVDRVTQQIQQYANTAALWKLPPIYSYWNCRYVIPRVQQASGVGSIFDTYFNAIATAAQAKGGKRAVLYSIGAGDCTVETMLAEKLRAAKIANARIVCLELSPVRLERARRGASAKGVADLMEFKETDLNLSLIHIYHQVLDINYEDLTGATAEPVQAGLLDFLGLPPHALRTVIARLAEDDLSRSIANFAELKAHFRNTPFIHYFQEA